MRGVEAPGILLLSLVLSFLAAGVGGMFTRSGIDSGWYETIRKPPWTPPGWLFGPVWTALYVAMAVAAWLVCRAADWVKTREALLLYAVQLLFNASWSFFFFYLENPLAGLVELLVLWALLLLTMVSFWKLRPAAGWLFVPYLGWVSFAALLNAEIWWLNR